MNIAEASINNRVITLTFAVVMLGGGYFTPLTGFMNLTDALSVSSKMQTVDGLFCRADAGGDPRHLVGTSPGPPGS